MLLFLPFTVASPPPPSCSLTSSLAVSSSFFFRHRVRQEGPPLNLDRIDNEDGSGREEGVHRQRERTTGGEMGGNEGMKMILLSRISHDWEMGL